MQKHLYIVYARKSSEGDDAQASSIQDQLNIITPLAKKNNLEIFKTITEAKSSKVPQARAGFNEMIDIIDNNPAIKGIICWNTNRLSRNPEEEGLIRQRLSDGRILEIVTPNRIYLAADSDYLMATEGAHSQRYLKELSEAVLRGLNSKLERGLFPSLAPPGYFNNKDMPDGHHDIRPHPIYFDLLRKVFDLELTGNYSIKALTQKSKELGIKNSKDRFISKTQMYCILKNPFYYGCFKYRGLIHQGVHQPMITLDEFNIIQGILAGKGHPQVKKHTFPFTGLIKCACGNMITATHKTKTNNKGVTRNFVYYHCTEKDRSKCPRVHVTSKDLEQQALAYLDKIQIPREFIDLALETIYESNTSVEQSKTLKRKSLNAAMEGVEKRLSNLLELKLNPKTSESITDEEFTTHRKKLMQEKIEINYNLKKIDNNEENWMDFAVELFNFTSTLDKRFLAGTIEDKKNLLKAIGSSLILDGKKLRLDFRTPFKVVRAALESAVLEANRLEPNKTYDLSSRLNDLVLGNLVGRDLPNAIRTIYDSNDEDTRYLQVYFNSL